MATPCKHYSLVLNKANRPRTASARHLGPRHVQPGRRAAQRGARARVVHAHARPARPRGGRTARAAAAAGRRRARRSHARRQQLPHRADRLGGRLGPAGRPATAAAKLRVGVRVELRAGTDRLGGRLGPALRPAVAAARLRVRVRVGRRVGTALVAGRAVPAGGCGAARCAGGGRGSPSGGRSVAVPRACAAAGRGRRAACRRAARGRPAPPAAERCHGRRAKRAGRRSRTCACACGSSCAAGCGDRGWRRRGSGRPCCRRAPARVAPGPGARAAQAGGLGGACSARAGRGQRPGGGPAGALLLGTLPGPAPPRQVSQGPAIASLQCGAADAGRGRAAAASAAARGRCTHGRSAGCGRRRPSRSAVGRRCGAGARRGPGGRCGRSGCRARRSGRVAGPSAARAPRAAPDHDLLRAPHDRHIGLQVRVVLGARARDARRRQAWARRFAGHVRSRRGTTRRFRVCGARWRPLRGSAGSAGPRAACRCCGSAAGCRLRVVGRQVSICGRSRAGSSVRGAAGSRGGAMSSAGSSANRRVSCSAGRPCGARAAGGCRGGGRGTRCAPVAAAEMLRRQRGIQHLARLGRSTNPATPLLSGP